MCSVRMNGVRWEASVCVGVLHSISAWSVRLRLGVAMIVISGHSVRRMLVALRVATLTLVSRASC
jgi:hypothetical protein